MQKDLTEKQKQVLSAIRDYWSEFQVPPSLGDLAGSLNLSRATMHHHVHVLISKGWLQSAEGVQRSWRPVDHVPENTLRIPVVGRVAAGEPILAEQNIEGWISVDRVRTGETLFALRVKGDSMTEGGIFDGDLVIVRQQPTAENGDIVVARIEDEATVKKLQRTHEHVLLIPMNCEHETIVVCGDHVHLDGKVVGVRRSMEEE